MKRLISLILTVILAAAVCTAPAEEARKPKDEAERNVDLGVLISDLADARKALQLIDEDTEALDDELATLIAEEWKMLYLDPDYRVWVNGKDNPAELPDLRRDGGLGISQHAGRRREILRFHDLQKGAQLCDGHTVPLPIDRNI